MSALNNAPLTPPLTATENDAQQVLGGQSRSPTTAFAPRTSAYLSVFPNLSNFAMQNNIPALVELAEATDLNADSESRWDESRLLLVAPLVLSYIILDEHPSARIALSRLPENLVSHPLSHALLRLLAAVQNRVHPLVYKSTEDLVTVVQAFDFFDKSLAAVMKLLAERLISAFRHKMMRLIARAYTSIPHSLAQSYLGLPEDGVREIANSYLWTYDSTIQILHPSSSSPHNIHVSATSGNSVSSLSTIKHVTSSCAVPNH